MSVGQINRCVYIKHVEFRENVRAFSPGKKNRKASIITRCLY